MRPTKCKLLRTVQNLDFKIVEGSTVIVHFCKNNPEYCDVWLIGENGKECGVVTNCSVKYVEKLNLKKL